MRAGRWWLFSMLSACVIGRAGGPEGTDPTDTTEPRIDTSATVPTSDPAYDPVADNRAHPAGGYAFDYLTDNTYTSLEVEIDFVKGNRPKASAVRALREALEALCRKPGGVTVTVDEEIPGNGSPAWSLREADAMELEWRDTYHDPRSWSGGDVPALPGRKRQG